MYCHSNTDLVLCKNYHDSSKHSNKVNEQINALPVKMEGKQVEELSVHLLCMTKLLFTKRNLCHHDETSPQLVVCHTK